MNSEIPIRHQLIRAEIEHQGRNPSPGSCSRHFTIRSTVIIPLAAASIGRKGDYFTNVSVGPLFGQVLVAQFAEIWERSVKSTTSPSLSRVPTTASLRATFSNLRKNEHRNSSKLCTIE